MVARNLTLTSIGLPVRTELRLKSMLEVVKNMTVDNWSYSQDGDADLAICEPNSALTTLAVKRKHATGETHCALLVKDEQQLTDDLAQASSLPLIHDPVRPTEFLSLLNSISERSGAMRRRSIGESPNTASAIDEENSVFALALALRNAAKSASDVPLKLGVGSFELVLAPRSKIVLQSKKIDTFDITELADKSDAVVSTNLDADEFAQWQQANCNRMTLGAMLWRLGMFGSRNRLLSFVNPAARFKLRRWPDFGRLEHTADHMRLAARVGKQFAGLAEMAAFIDQPVEKVRPFINACVLCELMVIHVPADVPAEVPAATGKASVQAESKYKGLFQSIRSALHFAMS